VRNCGVKIPGAEAKNLGQQQIPAPGANNFLMMHGLFGDFLANA
jgi:hypothetical protein